MKPAQFLHLLWQGKPESLYVLIWVRQGKRSHWFRDIPSAAAFVQKIGGQNDVYVGVGLSERDYGFDHRCKSEDVAGLAGFWSDFDLQSQAHPNKSLPATIEAALSIIPAEFAPTVVVITGNGVHVWWLFKEPWIYESEEERKKAAALSSRWQTLLRYKAAENGWAFDRLSDLARVLRIPGTFNVKDPQNPKPVTVHSVSERRYISSDFERYLDELGVPGPDQEERSAHQLAEQFVNTSLVINLNAVIPEQTLNGWMEKDQRFRNTWNRQRPDLADQSGSGYDMALAYFGVRAGLNDQQIVDLIIHHRRIHGEQQRKRMDYFHRTISKARKAEVPTNTLPCGLAALPSASERNSGGGTDAGAGEPAVKRAMLCDRISQLFGVRVIRIVRLAGSDPIYLMHLPEGQIEFDIKKLMSHKAVSMALAAKAGKLIPVFKGKHWQELVQLMLDACTPLEGTDDLELEGNSRIQIGRYLSEVPFIASVVGVSKEDRFKPLVDAGRIAISATDMQAFLSRVTSQALSVKAVATMCAAVGGVAIRHRPNGKVDQSRWALPPEEFDPKEYARDFEDGADGE